MAKSSNDQILVLEKQVATTKEQLAIEKKRADTAEDELKSAEKELELSPCKDILVNEKALQSHTKLNFEMFNLLLGLFMEWISSADVHRQFRNVLIVPRQNIQTSSRICSTLGAFAACEC